MGGVLSASPLEAGTALGLKFAQYSSGTSYSPNFRALRAAEESHPLNFVDIREVSELYNVPFTMSELCSSLPRCKDGAAGPDGFSYLFFVIFIPQRWSFCLVFSTRFKRLNVFPTYDTSQLSFPFQNRARITLCLGTSLQSLRPLVSVSCWSEFWLSAWIGSWKTSMIYPPSNLGSADSILRLEHGISALFENGKFVLAIFFDLQKAHDTTWKRGVLRKLLSLGLCGHLPLPIRNLLVNRTFRV